MTPLLPSVYIGNIEYYSILKNSDAITIEQHEHFVKQSFRNRARIYGANGALNLIVPRLKLGERTAMKDIKISYDSNWQKLHWKSIESAYRSSPFFEFYEDDLHPIFHKKHDFLIDYNTELQQKLLSFLHINVDESRSKSYIAVDQIETDLRYAIHPKRTPLYKRTFEPYNQVFESKHGFIPNLSVIDLLFNEGPNSGSYL